MTESQRLTIVECGEYTRPDYTPAGNPIRGVMFGILGSAAIAVGVPVFVDVVQGVGAFLGVR